MRNAFADLIESATTRFSGATEDMRRAAQGIRAELEETRAEIKKGVLDLPMEAKESSTAIRRAVSEQINATLNREGAVIGGDLNKVVDVTDFWTFQRDTRSRDPNWTLVATRSSD